MLTAISQLAAPWVARRIGLLNTMVFTHIPSSLALIAAAFASQVEVALDLLLLRAALSQLDVPTRSASGMAAVTPPERAAAASNTSVELTRFRGHLTVGAGGVHDGSEDDPVHAGVQATDGRAGPLWADAGLAVEGVRAVGLDDRAVGEAGRA